MDDSNKQIDKYLSPFNEEIRSLALQLREYLRNETKPAYEIIGDSHHSFNMGFGFTEKTWDCYCAIVAYSNHINISFPAGASLSDPEGLLIGSGSKIRHIRIREFNDIKKPKIARLINEARKNASDLVERHKEYYEPIYTIVKGNSGKKGRSR